MDYGNKKMRLARFIDPESGKEQIVRLPNAVAFVTASVAYNEQDHKGHLLCTECDAKIHYNQGSSNILANTGSANAHHFKRNPKQKHEENCTYYEHMVRQLADAQDKQDKQEDIDPTKGYSFLLKINVKLACDDNGGKPAYHRRRDPIKLSYTTIINDPRLEGMERVPVRSMNELVKLLHKLDLRRVAKSYVVRNDQVIPFSDFMVRYSRGVENPDQKNMKFKNMFEELLQHKKPLMRIMEIWPKQISKQEKSIFVASEHIPYKRPNAERNFLQINPRVYLETAQHKGLENLVAAGRKYLVFGEISLKQYEERYYAMKISVKKPEQIAEFNLDEMAIKKESTPVANPDKVQLENKTAEKDLAALSLVKKPQQLELF